MKICVIGSNSYLARNFVKQFVKLSELYEFYLYDVQPCSFDKYANYVQVNILDKESVKLINMNCDMIYLFSGKTGTTQGFDLYEEFLKVNELGLLNILDFYRSSKSCGKIIFLSTRLIYKGSNELLNEQSEKQFKTPYAISKYACEQYLQMWSNVFNVKYCILRLCVPYGSLVNEAHSYGTIGFMIKSALQEKEIRVYGDGLNRRTITYIEDLDNILLLVGTSDKCMNDVYNVSGEVLSIKEIAQKIAILFNATTKLVPFPNIQAIIETGSTAFDDSKLNAILHYEYKSCFELYCNSLERKLGK